MSPTTCFSALKTDANITVLGGKLSWSMFYSAVRHMIDRITSFCGVGAWEKRRGQGGLAGLARYVLFTSAITTTMSDVDVPFPLP